MKKLDLENSPKIQSGFKIPDNYFENFSVPLPKDEAKIIPFWKQAQYKLLTAAAVIAFVISIPMLNFYFNNQQENLQNDIENYLVYNSAITTDELSEYQTNSIYNTLDFSKINTEEIEEQLLEIDFENYILN